MGKPVGLDFGTANSAIAVKMPDGSVQLASFRNQDKLTTTFKSILYFSIIKDGLSRSTNVVAGPEAIRSYVEADIKGRLIQSIKSFLPSNSFTHTEIFGRTYTIEELISIIIRELRNAAIEQFGEISESVVIGRPVKFAGAKNDEDEQRALNRLRSAAQRAGFESVSFEFEPVAAAYQYAKQLDHEELVLIADFGGGTSDFSLLRLGPLAIGGRGYYDQEIIGSRGVALAGDTFDGKIVRHAVAPSLGLGSYYRSLGKELPIPLSIYRRLERWHEASFLKTPQILKLLREVKVQALEPQKVDALSHIIINDLGYDLFRAVERTKIDLSENEASQFSLANSSVELDYQIDQDQFESWIQGDIEQISNCVDNLLIQCNVNQENVDSIFLTGGSSLVPAVRRLFEQRFSRCKIRFGDELTTVAKGLALCANSLKFIEGRV